MKLSLLAILSAFLFSGSIRGETAPQTPGREVLGKTTIQEKEFYFDLSLEGQYLVGSSQYNIQGSDSYWGSWESGLEWPLNCFLLGGKGSAGFSGNRYVLNISFMANLTDEPGDLKDYDWISGEKVTKGVVDTSLEAYIFDISFYWNMVQKVDFTLGLGLGFTWQHFYWEGNAELTQTEYDSAYNRYWGIPPGTYIYPKELWITYRMDYYLPYLGVAAKYTFSDIFELAGEGKMMLVLAQDKDDHVQRQKEAKSLYGGLGMEAKVEGILYPVPWAYLALSLRGTVLEAVGEQDQTFYDGSGIEYNGIDAETESIQGYFGGRLGIVF